VNNQPTSTPTAAESDQHQHGTNWHIWLMMLCCLIPLAALVAISVFGIPFNGVFSFAMILLCPLMMVFMMRDGNAHH
jgi:Flp pilus assembly protein TadB